MTKKTTGLLEDEKHRRLMVFLDRVASEPEGNPEQDVLRALVQHPAALRPLYLLIVGDATQGRAQMISEILRRVRQFGKVRP